MLVKKTLTVVCPGCSGHSPFCTAPKATLASLCPSRQQPSALHVQGRRTYATTLPDDEFLHGSRESHDQHSKAQPGDQKAEDGKHGRKRHPQQQHRHIPWPTSKHPTPYEILDLKRGAPYHKTRYYDLVKQYHPDRRHHRPTHLHGVPQATMLERYRLVVTANDILSNPQKRRAYDLYGAGWAGAGDMHDALRAASRAWRNQPNSPAMNATWEDWERWRRAKNGEKQEPRFMSNVGFAMVVFVGMLVGTWAQATRLGSFSDDVLDMAREQNRSVNRTLLHQQGATSLLSREDRVDHFLERREGWGYTLPPSPRRSSTDGK